MGKVIFLTLVTFVGFAVAFAFGYRQLRAVRQMREAREARTALEDRRTTETAEAAAAPGPSIRETEPPAS